MSKLRRINMNLPDADTSLVIMKHGTPHCKKHGAMNAVSRFLKNNKQYKIWRCISTYRVLPDIDIGKKKPQIGGMIEDNCLAGCITNKGG